jgi:hypothetical protein
MLSEHHPEEADFEIKQENHYHISILYNHPVPFPNPGKKDTSLWAFEACFVYEKL